MGNQWRFLSLLLIVRWANGQLQVPPIPAPTRSIDLWNPFGTTTTRIPGERLQKNEVIVRLPIGDLIGQRVLIENLPWTPNQDPLDMIPWDRDHSEPNPIHRHNNVTVFTFLGVPYAEPPTDYRRFKRPQQLIALPGDGPYLANQFAASCAQDVESRPRLFIAAMYPWRVNEDCLYLNIFSPEVSVAAQLKYPVLVFFHGGNFQTGSANEWPGHVLATRGLVVVTVNYRLGAFGWMSLGDSDTGNYGLQDQRLALEWVRDHIASFSGDPQAVTIVGHDAGAVSVGLHMLSPLSKSLFRSASMMSGAEVSYHSTIGKPALAYNNTIKLGRYLGCVQKIAMDVWNCILTRSTSDIVQATYDIPIEFNRYLFMPSVDGLQVPANPYWMLNLAPSGQVDIPSPVPLLIGLNKEDGAEVVLEDRKLGEFNDFILVDQEYMHSFVIEYAFRHNYTMNREAIAEAIETRYTYWPDKADFWSIREKFVEMATDAYYTAPIALSAHLHSETGSRVFMYVNNYNFSRPADYLFRHNHTMLPHEDTVRMVETRYEVPYNHFLPGWMGVCHECDLYMLFGFPFMPKHLLPLQFQTVNWTHNDRNASHLFGLIYRQFTKYQDPNLPMDGSWAALQPRRHWYMNFNYSWEATKMKVAGILERDYRWQHVAFWNEYLPQLVNFMTTTFSPEDVVLRREAVAFKTVIGIETIFLIIVVVIALSLAYLVFERYQLRRYDTAERRYLVPNIPLENYPSSQASPRHPTAAPGLLTKEPELNSPRPQTPPAKVGPRHSGSRPRRQTPPSRMSNV